MNRRKYIAQWGVVFSAIAGLACIALTYAGVITRDTGVVVVGVMCIATIAFLVLFFTVKWKDNERMLKGRR